MKNFTYHSPTKIHFGEQQIEQLENELELYKDSNILLVYGKSSIKNLGIYDDIYNITKSLNIQVVEESDVRPNPEVSSVRSGVSKCKDNDIRFILAAGGGSVVDCAKAIGLGYYLEEDVWNLYNGTSKPGKSLPIGAIITLAATGTETNGNSVISNDETNEKRACASTNSIPRFAIIDPTYTLTVNHHHTVSGSMDIIMHALEQFFSNTTRTETTDYMICGLIESVYENTLKIHNGENTYDNRSNISWASTIALNWILGVDKVGDWATHRLSYPITNILGISHGFALVSIFSSWMRVALKYNPETMKRRLSLFGSRMFDETDPNTVIANIEQMFEDMGGVTNLHEYQKNSDQQFNLEDIAKNAVALGNVGTVVSIDYEKALEILELSYRGE